MSERKTKFYKSRNKFILSCFLTLSFFASAGLNACALEITAESMVRLTNQSRAESGLESLSVNSKLSRAARLKAGDMLEFDYFDHTSPAGVDPWHWIKLTGYNYHYAGENLAIDFITAEGTHQALMESSSHRDNILNPRFEEIGVAVLKGEFEGSDSTVVVEMFASPFNSGFNSDKNETSGGIEMENKAEIKIKTRNDKTKVELEIKPELKPEPESEIEIKTEPDFDSALNSEIADIPKEKESALELAPESAAETLPKRELDLLAVILAEENSNLVGDYLTGGLYFKDNDEIFKKYKKGAVLASADAKFSGGLENNLVVSLLSLILGADLLFSLLIFKGGNRGG